MKKMLEKLEFRVKSIAFVFVEMNNEIYKAI